MTKDYSKKIITIPNILSLLRIVLIPVIVWFYVFENKPYIAAVLLIVSGITDMIDGYVARRFNMISNFGKGLDPVADKLTQFVVLICLVFEFPEMIIPCILLMIKEIVSAITALRAIRKTGKVYGANWHGKVTTAILYVMIFVHILWSDIPPEVSIGFVVLSVFMMLLSSVMYNMRNIRAFRNV